MSLDDLLAVLQDSPISQWILRSNYAFPAIEVVHVICLCTVIGTVAVVDLRLLGMATHTSKISRVASDLLGLTWIAFAGAVVSGFLMFSSSAASYAGNVYFQVKMLLLICAGINMGVFHLFTYRNVSEWDDAATVPARARVAGALSLLFWVGVVAAGRWIGF